jgi:SAM-dependent methyltransferase
MNWKLKATAQMVASSLPLGAELNYLGQRVVMRRFGSVDRSAADRLAKARWIAAEFQQRSATPLSAATFFELGTGWHMGVPLALWCLGVERQITVDVRRLARVELVNKVIAALQTTSAELLRRPGMAVRSFAELETRYGIEYRAPADARATGLPTESIDCVHSTLTLQHIPGEVLKTILRESRRILTAEGLLLSIIDYKDNYAYTDRSITAYNFLQYPEKRWRWFNPPLHFQNRLRHAQYHALFEDCGFCVVGQAVNAGTGKDLEAIRKLRVAPEFAGFAAEDLAVRSSSIAAVKSATA